MPQAPFLPPDVMAQTQANAGLNPQNFLMAAADLHKSGQLSAPVPKGTNLPQLPKRNPRKIQVVK